jgi:Fe-S-cluster containining protein
MPNYLLGGILADPDPSLTDGKERVYAQITAKAGVTPYGIIPPRPYQERKKVVNSHDFWSRPHELMEQQQCPYYDKGNCTVWDYRENLCVTYFCSSIGGNSGNKFWGKLNKYVKMAETKLAQYAMLRLGWPVNTIKTGAVSTEDFNLEDEQGIVDHGKYSQIWGAWEGREKEFFLSCYNIIKDTDAPTFKAITGLSREILDAGLRVELTNFSEGLFPDYLQLHPELVITTQEDGFSRLSLGGDFLEVASVLLPIVRGFNGHRTTVEVFHLGYNVLVSIDHIVNDLLAKGMLKNVEYKENKN